MIIKSVTIKNFRSYYGENTFKFSDGLTLIIGENGDGKTTFFEALQWLLDTSSTDPGRNARNVSEKRKSELSQGESDELSVSMAFEHNDTSYSVEKSFVFEIQQNGDARPGKCSFRGYESSGCERTPLEGKVLIDRCFDSFIQKFSLFKGEAELDVLNSQNALKELIDKFSSVRKFDKIAELASDMEDKANKAYGHDCREDKKTSDETSKIQSQLDRVTRDLDAKNKEKREKEKSISNYEKNIDAIKGNQAAAERYKEWESKRSKLKDNADKCRSLISRTDKNTALLDKLWILCAFQPILEEFRVKAAAFSESKRKQYEEFIKQQGKNEFIKSLPGGKTMLPWNLPDQSTMEEMLRDHICKVCGREAPEGSGAYEFMANKLAEFKAHTAQEANKEQIHTEESPFKSKHVEEISDLNIRLGGSEQEELAQIPRHIQDKLELDAKITEDLKEIDGKLKETEEELSRLRTQTNTIGDELSSLFEKLSGNYDQKERAMNRLRDIQNEIDEKEKLKASLLGQLTDLINRNGSTQAKMSQKIHAVLDHIANAVKNAQAENRRRFLNSLEDKANNYLAKLSARDFHGEVRLRPNTDDATEIRLISSNGTEISNPSGSQRTVMYMSVLFAISDMTNEKRNEMYPLIFDAATSSFGDTKEEEFYNVIDKLHKQCIIVTKDFMMKGRPRMEDIDRLSCDVYRIKKAPGFDPRNMATIMTTIEKIK